MLHLWGHSLGRALERSEDNSFHFLSVPSGIGYLDLLLTLPTKFRTNTNALLWSITVPRLGGFIHFDMFIDVFMHCQRNLTVVMTVTMLFPHQCYRFSTRGSLHSLIYMSYSFISVDYTTTRMSSSLGYRAPQRCKMFFILSFVDVWSYFPLSVSFANGRLTVPAVHVESLLYFVLMVDFFTVSMSAATGKQAVWLHFYWSLNALHNSGELPDPSAHLAEPRRTAQWPPLTSWHTRYWSMAQTVGTCVASSWYWVSVVLHARAQISRVFPTALSPTTTHLMVSTLGRS